MTQIELDGQTIARVSDRPPLALHTGNEWVVTVESALTFTGAGSPVRSFEGDDMATASALGSLLSGLTVREATVEGSSLRLAFTNGAELTAPPDPDYESWGVTGPDGQRTVCMPGGEVAVWIGSGPAQ